MLIAPVYPNSVTIPMIQTGCMKTGFDPTYPIYLNGIISQDEFEQSTGGFALCIAGGALLHGIVALIVVEFMLLGISLFSLLIGCQAVQSHRINRMRQAVAEESKKYSMRSPTPCSWRLNVNRWWSRGRGGQHISYRVSGIILQNFLLLILIKVRCNVFLFESNLSHR
ncbi:unnamed protein product [Rotaria magnacalcarata]